MWPLAIGGERAVSSAKLAGVPADHFLRDDPEHHALRRAGRRTLSLANTPAGGQVLDRLLPFLVGGHRQLALENLALRQQLAVYKRTVNRPKFRRSDRLLWVWLSKMWPAWRQALVIVAPATVLHRQRLPSARGGI